MRIFYISDAASPHTQRWIKYFARKGHEVHLASSYSFGSYWVKNVKLHMLYRFRPQIFALTFLINSFINIIKVRRLLKKIKPDILHAHWVSDYGFWGATSGFHPFILTPWGSDILVHPKRRIIHKTFAKYALRKADLITCDAEHLVEEMTKFGIKKEKMWIIYFAIDPQDFHPKQRSEKLQQELGIAGSPTIISTRHLKPIYDIESLINAIPLVLREVPEAKFIIVGDGDQRTYLKDLAKSLGVSENTRFTGYIPNKELPSYLASSDIYVSTSLSDGGIASSTAEAMACELPAVITDFGNNRDWVKEGISGYLVPLKNPEALASKIIDLLKNKDRRREFGQAGRRVILEKSDWEIEMGKMEKFYSELVKRHREE